MERNRVSLLQAFRQNANNEVFLVNVNHLKSKGSACDIPDSGDGQGNCAVVRTNAVLELLNWFTTNPTGTGDTDILLIGDLNSYAKEDPIDALEDSGFVNLNARFGGDQAYSYVFSAQWGYLDYALANASLLGQVVNVTEWHINSDEPPVLDYNTNFKSAGQIVDLYSPDPFRTSDHDPILVDLNLDATAPSVVSITRASANPTGAASVDFTVTFSEDVTGVGVADFGLTTTGSITGASVTGVTPVNASVYTVTVNTGTGNGTLRLDVPASATITDLAGNALSGLPYTGGQAYDIHANITVNVGPTLAGTYLLPSGQERREYYALSGGPVKVQSTNGSTIVSAIRLQSYANNTLYSFVETMGVPQGLLSHKYVFPTYNNTWAPLNSQIRFGNLETTTTRIRVTIGGVNVWEDDVPGLEERRLYFNVSGGPVVVESLDTGKKIVAAIRLQSYANNTLYSFVETMGVPEGLLSHKYVFPTYNNTWAPLNSQIRFGNLETTTTRIRVTIGGAVVWEDDVPGLQERRLYFNVSGGPVVVESLDTGRKIVAAIRLQSYANDTLYSFSETMGVPAGFLSHTYYFPTYQQHPAPLNSRLRFGVP